MRKREIFDEMIGWVSAETELPAGVILSRNRSAEVVDARYILIENLSRYGFYAAEIGRLMGISSRNVAYVLASFASRKKRRGTMFRLVAERIKERTQAAMQ